MEFELTLNEDLLEFIGNLEIGGIKCKLWDIRTVNSIRCKETNVLIATIRNNHGKWAIISREHSTTLALSDIKPHLTYISQQQLHLTEIARLMVPFQHCEVINSRYCIITFTSATNKVNNIRAHEVQIVHVAVNVFMVFAR